MFKWRLKKQMDPGSYSDKMKHLFENKRQDSPHENIAYPESIENADVVAIPHFHEVVLSGKAAVLWLSARLLPAELNLYFPDVRTNYIFFRWDETR